MRDNLQQKAKPKMQLVCVRALILVVFWVCAHSNKHCTCGQASAHHINSTHDTPAVPKQHDYVTHHQPGRNNDNNQKSVPMIWKDTLETGKTQAKASN